MQASGATTGQAVLASDELLADWLENFGRGVRDEIAELTPEAMAWRPREQSNSIGVTVWHCARWLDVIAVQALRGKPA